MYSVFVVVREVIVSLFRRVVHLAELARRMETEQETILPFVSSLVPQSKPAGDISDKSSGKSGPDELETKEPNDLEMTNSNLPPPPPNQASVWTSNSSHAVPVPVPDRMQNFFRKYNKSLLDCIAIEKEKERLALENIQLQELIGQYISGTKVRLCSVHVSVLDRFFVY